MTTTMEAGQGRKSAAALNLAMEASMTLSDARWQYREALAELRKARAAMKLAEVAERVAFAAYEATDYTS
jgi:hypothetical protein